MNRLFKFIHRLSRPVLALLLVFAMSFTAISPTHALSHYPSQTDLNVAKYNIQSVGAYTKYATLASAVTGVETNNMTIDSLIAAITDLDSTFHFINQTPSELISFARNLPFYKEYAYLRTLVNEITYLYNNYDYISASEEAWKIPYIIDRAENAVEGCNLIFGTSYQNTSRSANRAINLADATPYSATSATVIAAYVAKTDVLRSANSAQLPRRHQSSSNTDNANNTSASTSTTSTSSTSTSNDNTQPISASPNNTTSNIVTAPSKTDSPTTDSDDSSTQNTDGNPQTLVAVAAHTSTAIVALGTLFLTQRHLKKSQPATKKPQTTTKKPSKPAKN